MRSLRHKATALAVVLLALASIASALSSSGGTIVYLGDLSLVASSTHSAEKAAKPMAAVALDANPANNTTQNRTAPDNLTTNLAPKGKTEPLSLGSAKPALAAQPSGKGIMDLSGYAKARAKSNLTGYTNIMYPIAGSRGTTTSTSSGGGCCGG